MVIRLVVGSLAATLLPLGAVFIVIGLVADDVDRGSPEGFLYAGVPIATVGLFLALASLGLWRQAVERRRRRRLRTAVEVVSVRLHPNIRSRGTVAMDLTVRLPGGAPGSRRFFVLPGLQPEAGGRVEIAYDPDDPSNFEPVTSA
jgi:hypothetical protein